MLWKQDGAKAQAAQEGTGVSWPQEGRPHPGIQPGEAACSRVPENSGNPSLRYFFNPHQGLLTSLSTERFRRITQ